MRLAKKRRLNSKTDYKARLTMLKSEKPRIVFRKTNRYIIGQFIESEEAKDRILIGVNSKELIKYGWPEDKEGALKSLTACYLLGFLLGKKILDKKLNKDSIFDIGLLRNIKKSRIYSFLKGVIDAGIKINVGKKEIFPDEKRIISNKEEIFKKIKQNIEKKLI